MSQPNFLILGAPKAGTTSLYHYLKQHPDVFMPSDKEPNIFFHLNNSTVYRDALTTHLRHDDTETKYDCYLDLFKGAKAKAIGEASTLYLPFAHAARNIKAHLPQVKLIAILRNPAERAYSHYVHLLRDNREPIKTFAEALAAESERVASNWYPSFHYRTLGYYHAQLSSYLALFPKENLRVYLFEDLKEPQKLATDIFRFLGVDERFQPDVSLQLNASGLPKSQALHGFVKSDNPLKTFAASLLPERFKLKIVDHINKRNLAKAPALEPTLKARLLEGYKEDILKLQDVLERDLSGWLKT